MKSMPTAVHERARFVVMRCAVGLRQAFLLDRVVSVGFGLFAVLSFPECVARVPVSLGGLGGEAVFAKFCVCGRNRPQVSATACVTAVRLSTVASASGVVQKACQIDCLSPQLYGCLQRRCLWE